MTTRLLGLPAAPGIGIGAIAVYRPALPSPATTGVAVKSPPEEWQAFTVAAARLDAELEHQAQNENTLVAELFAAHRVILQDRTLVDGVQRFIYEEGESALTATHKIIHELTALFRSFEDEYFAGRAVDIQDLGRRLMSHLSPAVGWSQLSHLAPQTILLAYDLTPSELTLLAQERIQGIGLAYSTPTAHSAILAHSLGIPMVCTLGARILQLPPGTSAVVDGINGLLLIEPSAADVAEYARRNEGLHAAQISARRDAHTPAITGDGVPVPIFANANRPADVEQARAHGADGIGLLRTEYLFLERAHPPTVEEQAAVYREFAQQMPGPFVVRALDAGGDKPVRYIDHEVEANPFLGLRGIRLLLEKPDLLRNQYHALQLASLPPEMPTNRPTDTPIDTSTDIGTDFRFLLPMISTVDEIEAIHALLEEANCALPRLPVGAMIEVPSAALIAEAIAERVDFLSIGTNDLAQYTLASDRTNSAVARLADPLHPAVLRLIQHTCQAGQRHNKPVAVCGEIAGDPLVTPLLLGLGVTALSAPLPDIALIKATVRRQTLAACRHLAQAALACATAGEVRTLLENFQV
ncbi:MAG: putative PEP-binding protein [Litorilinea sp.]